jgi:VWFA-related protein
MTRTSLALALVASLSIVAPQAQDQPPASTGGKLSIDASFVDKQGKPVLDLTPEEIEVWIGPYRIPIEDVATGAAKDDDQRRAMALVIDDITLTPVGMQRAKDVARHFVKNLVAGDQVVVMRLSGSLAKSTDDPAALLQAIDSISMPTGQPFIQPDHLGGHVLETLKNIAQQIGESDARRKTIVGIGAGWLFDTPIPPVVGGQHLDRAMTDAARAMIASGTTLYVVDPGGVGMAPIPGGRHGFARDMGGHAFINTNDLKGAVDRIVAEMDHYYTITIADPPVARAELREVEVRVKRKGVQVRAKRFLRGTVRV